MKHDRSFFRRSRIILRLTSLFLLVLAGAVGRTDVVWSQVRIPAEAYTSDAQLQQVCATAVGQAEKLRRRVRPNRARSSFHAGRWNPFTGGVT